ncbi:hypothetical protein EDD75_0359 [Thermodesulfitimonas autotrophica]|uniref:Uncharacterized protein n=1 Tax=Thermodesulfitimonas autotrophica TaxID=1894989 RepID=A0A3N5BPJ0_9THEO|nr:hypothetical protein [Thermodesulfitimonas autotrophica]RPF49542.1 hypothetical protein EDD75_0359 [Thermodesulfitimonas autotrophica]
MDQWLLKKRCPLCGECHLSLRENEEFLRFFPGPELNLERLEEDEKAAAVPPCGWLVVRAKTASGGGEP